MTKYQRLKITGPKEAFDKIAEKVYVENRSRDELEVIIDISGEGKPDQVVRDIVEEEVGSFSDYSCSGGWVKYQEDLPEELRDEGEYEDEQDDLSPDEKEWTDNDVTSTLAVLQAVKEHEKTKAADRDVIDEAQDRLKELYGDDLRIQYSSSDEITADDVDTTINLLKAEGVDHRGKDEYDHPNNSLKFALDYVQQRLKHSEDFLPRND